MGMNNMLFSVALMYLL